MLKKQTNRKNQTIRGAVLAFVALVALAATATAPAGGTGTIAIRHQTRGCHSWSFNSGPVQAGAVRHRQAPARS